LTIYVHCRGVGSRHRAYTNSLNSRQSKNIILEIKICLDSPQSLKQSIHLTKQCWQEYTDSDHNQNITIFVYESRPLPSMRQFQQKILSVILRDKTSNRPTHCHMTNNIIAMKAKLTERCCYYNNYCYYNNNY